MLSSLYLAVCLRPQRPLEPFARQIMLASQLVKNFEFQYFDSIHEMIDFMAFHRQSCAWFILITKLNHSQSIEGLPSSFFFKLLMTSISYLLKKKIMGMDELLGAERMPEKSHSASLFPPPIERRI